MRSCTKKLQLFKKELFYERHHLSPHEQESSIDLMHQSDQTEPLLYLVPWIYNSFEFRSLHLIPLKSDILQKAVVCLSTLCSFTRLLQAQYSCSGSASLQWLTPWLLPVFTMGHSNFCHLARIPHTLYNLDRNNRIEIWSCILSSSDSCSQFHQYLLAERFLFAGNFVYAKSKMFPTALFI